MKTTNLLKVIAIFAIPAMMISCGKKNDDKTAVTPLTTACLSGQTYCDSTLYNQGYPYFMAYPGQTQMYGGQSMYGYMGYNQYSGYNPYGGGYNTYSMQQSFCDCGANGRPVYNNAIGLGCVSNQIAQPVAGSMVYWYLSAQNTQWVNIPQVSSTSGYSNSGACYNNVASACLTDQPNSCGTGYYCMPAGGANRIGLCVRQ